MSIRLRHPHDVCIVGLSPMSGPDGHTSVMSAPGSYTYHTCGPRQLQGVMPLIVLGSCIQVSVLCRFIPFMSVPGNSTPTMCVPAR